jgi:hypothetical protein
MSLSNYEASVNGPYKFLDKARDSINWDHYLGSTWPHRCIRDLVYMCLKRPVDGVLLFTWIFPSHFHIPISRLEELKRLEVTERVLNEL